MASIREAYKKKKVYTDLPASAARIFVTKENRAQLVAEHERLWNGELFIDTPEWDRAWDLEMALNAGFVYVVRVSKLYKIGKTKNLQARLNAIQVGNAAQAGIEWALQCMHYEYLEEYLHWYFQAKRVRGEWFSLSKDDLDVIMSGPSNRGYATVDFDKPPPNGYPLYGDSHDYFVCCEVEKEIERRTRKKRGV